MTTAQIENQKPATKTVGYGTPDASTALAPMDIPLREPNAHDVVLRIEYCGVCHSDIHQARDEWNNTVWPCVPGHEIVGRVIETGSHVTKFAAGDRVGVGCMVDSCRRCKACRAGEEQYCEGPRGFTATYNGPFKADGSNTFGGYSAQLVVNEDFVLRIPAGMDPKSAAPLLCSGVTTFSPLKHFKIGNGDTIGVVGIGGLGHVAIQIAKALGATVIAFTRTPEKAPDAKRFGATDVVVSTDSKAMEQYAGKLDFILSTVPTSHDVNPYLALLKRDGRMTLVGALETLEPGVNNGPAAFHRLSLGGSLIGSIEETQEILDFCAANNIASTVELIPIDRINEAFENVNDCKVRYRYVLDVERSLAS
jgi:uncharacterized zinc-type alcohol dehydrogenase-like protein